MESYFTTDEQRKAKNWDMLQQAKEEKANLARLGNEIRQVSVSLRKLSDALGDWETGILSFGESEVTIARHAGPQTPGHTIPTAVLASIPAGHGNLYDIQRLWEEAQASRRSLAQLVRELGDLGITP